MHHFSTVIGHDAVVASLSRAIQNKTLNHAYIFQGEAGVGKKTLTNAFAKALNCESPESGFPCACLSCRVFDSGNHPDITYVIGTNKTGIGADDVREQIVHPMSVRPFRYKYKIFITDKAGSLTPTAQNALLKTIEEPAGYGIFIFLTKPAQQLLPTVLSRCVMYKLMPLADEWVQAALKGIPQNKAAFYAKFSHGCIGRAKEIAESEDFTEMWELSKETTAVIGGTDLPALLLLYRRFEKFKDKINFLLDILYMCVSEADIHKTDIITQAKKKLQQNGHFQMCIETMLLDLKGR